MRRPLYYIVVIVILASRQTDPDVSFNDDIRPIFNAKCVGCHGGVKRAGGFGLVFRESALRKTASGKCAIVPGKPGRSEIISRVRHTNADLRMPFEARPLSEEDIQLLERWIDQGAAWEEHWSYLPPFPPEIPPQDESWDRNGIDAFVRTSLRQLGPGTRAHRPEKRPAAARLF